MTVVVTIGPSQNPKNIIMQDMETFFNRLKSFDLSRAQDRIVKDLRKRHRRYFDREISPHGRKWKPLAPSTIERKGHDRILFETGRLRRSLIQQTSDSVVKIRRMRGRQLGTITFGTKVPYAQYHQYGGRLPIRKHVGFSIRAGREYRRILHKEIIRALKEAARR